MIPRLQAAGLNVTSVQNPLTTLPEAVASALRVLARQDGPTVLAGHSFSGMIVTDAGVHPNVSAIVYVAARAPDAGEDYTTLAKAIPAVKYLMSKDGGEAKRFVLEGTDYVYPRTSNTIIRAFLTSVGVKDDDIMENYTPFGFSDWQIQWRPVTGTARW